MRRITLFLALSFAAVALVAPAAQQKIKVATASVPVYVTVTDLQRRLVPDLVQDDFEILDNGKLQPINIFENKPTAITTIVMLDTSGSMTASLDLVKEGAEQFLMRLLPEDKARWGRSATRSSFIPRPSSRRSRCARLVAEDELDFGYPTRLYDAVDESLARVGEPRWTPRGPGLHRRRRHGQQDWLRSK